ncbi:MAG: energy transducer TonB, partial [Deltaproteobacteria bacterium]|nr:energy transducer TonB [Deltaproteobacteria bacterium]
STSPQSIPRADLPEPDPGPEPPAAPIPAPPEAGAASSAVPEPTAPVRSPVGIRSGLPPLPPGTAPPSGRSSSAGHGPGRAIDLEGGYAYLRDDIQRGIAYPPVARRMGWEGNVVVSFRIHPDGSASDIRVVRGSGFAVLDRNAVEAVRSASPFRTPPAEAEIVTPVVYRLTPGPLEAAPR